MTRGRRRASALARVLLTGALLSGCASPVFTTRGGALEQVWSDHVLVVRMDSVDSISGPDRRIPHLFALGSRGDTLAIVGQGCPERPRYSRPPRLALGHTHTLRLRVALPEETGLYRITERGVVIDENDQGAPLYSRGEPFSTWVNGRRRFVVVDRRCSGIWR